MAIKQSIVIQTTGASFPNAYGRIDDSLLALGAGLLQVTLNWFADVNTASNELQPVRVDNLTLPASVFLTPNQQFVRRLKAACNDGSIITPQDALKTALYIILQQNPAYLDTLAV